MRTAYMLAVSFMLVLTVIEVAPLRVSGKNQETAARGIQVLQGYRHEDIGGMDTRRGKISKPKGPEIMYDIGALATNETAIHFKSKDFLWARSISIGAHSLELVMKDDETLYASFPRYYANFIGTRVRTKADLADVLLMIVTYDPIGGFKGQP